MTDTATEELQRTLLNHIPHYAVLLHNDEVHSMDFVVESLLKSVPCLTQPEAIAIMLETHQTGRGVVIVCPLEQAEHYRDRIRSFTLGCTIERA
ncbi:MAG: ATP-dependent Clp protease adaptor ClpS [Chloroflexi bacterium]|nr:ATP-dependent Clp protease adaptor ClpS [Chloroflexota bacterium]